MTEWELKQLTRPKTREELVELIKPFIAWQDPEIRRAQAECLINTIEQAGLAIVPREPTEAMLAMCIDWDGTSDEKCRDVREATSIYKAMIQAAEGEDSGQRFGDDDPEVRAGGPGHDIR